jgi:ElaB/YqjD/DUF883 family membrane-anchored ribosome-binding protein
MTDKLNHIDLLFLKVDNAHSRIQNLEAAIGTLRWNEDTVDADLEEIRTDLKTVVVCLEALAQIAEINHKEFAEVHEAIKYLDSDTDAALEKTATRIGYSIERRIELEDSLRRTRAWGLVLAGAIVVANVIFYVVTR